MWLLHVVTLTIMLLLFGFICVKKLKTEKCWGGGRRQNGWLSVTQYTMTAKIHSCLLIEHFKLVISCLTSKLEQSCQIYNIALHGWYTILLGIMAFITFLCCECSRIWSDDKDCKYFNTVSGQVLLFGHFQLRLSACDLWHSRTCY